MKTLFTKHKILLITLSAVLCLGVLSGMMLTGVIRFATNGGTFETVADANREQQAPEPEKAGSEAEPEKAGSEAESEKAESEAEPVSQTMTKPTPTPFEVKLSADDIKAVTYEVRQRRRYVIPVRTAVCPEENKMLWEQSSPDAADEDLAKQAAEAYTQTLYGKSYEELTGCPLDNAGVILYTDKEGDRDAFLRVTDTAGMYLVTIRQADRKLICADLLTYPETVTIDREKDALRLAEKLGYHSAALYREGSRRLNEGIYMLATDTDECLAFSYCGDQLWQFALYPNREAMLECEYFLADIQYDYETPAYPRNFVEAEAPQYGYDQMIPGDKIILRLKRLYNQLSGDSAIMNSDQMKATFYRDESGAREDCWKITGEGFDVTVSAYSRDVIRLDCSIPCKDLLSVPYDAMGGAEYEAVVRQIGEELFTRLGIYDESGDAHGKAVKSVDVNTVYDGKCCTMDVYLEDGTVYELGFANGVLMYAEHYANDRFFWVGINTGWVADTVYVNAATGKQYVPDYRDWDGDLHVSPRPER